MTALRIIHDPDADTVKIPRCQLLDRPSGSREILNILIADAVTRLYLVADGSTATITHDRVSGGGDQRTKAPTGGEWYHDILTSYYRCRTHRQRLAVILEAQEAHRRLTHSQARDPSLTPKSEEWKQRIAADPRPGKVLADVYGISLSSVRRIQAQYRSVSTCV